jgi:proprotein convertase subtilisin/kexin type 5
MTSTSPCTGCTTPTSNTIRFNTISASLSLQLSLTSSPQNATNGFTLVSYSSTDQMVQSGTTIVWFPKCASTVCRDCSGSTCVNCYTNNTISLNTILKDGTCTTECPQAGYYLVGVICQPCDSNCAECSKTSKNCTLCNAGTYLDSTTSTCVATCPDEYYKDDSTLTCQPCVSPCKKCTTSAVCLTCITDYFLFGTICTDNCTDGTYIENSQSGKCDPCSTNCLTCENYTF